MLIHEYKEQIYSVSGNHLGDVWASINYLYQLSVAEERTIKLSHLFNGMNIRHRLIECLEVLCDPGRIDIVPERATVKPINFGKALTCGYYSTRSVWAMQKATKTICYQFDSAVFKSGGGVGLNKRTIPNEDRKEFLEKAESLGWALENLGGRRPLKETVQVASTAWMHVGAVSGLAEVCTSIGIPLSIVVYDYPMEWARFIYSGRKCRLYRTLSDINLDAENKRLQSRALPEVLL